MQLRKWILSSVIILIFLFNIILFMYTHIHNFNERTVNTDFGDDRTLQIFDEKVTSRLNKLQDIMKTLRDMHKNSMTMLHQLENALVKVRGKMALLRVPFIVPILVLACNRPSVRRCLDQLIQRRMAFQSMLEPSDLSVINIFPIIVSQDCVHPETDAVIQGFYKKGLILAHLHQPDQSDIPNVASHMLGYYRLARHYKWALDQVFLHYNFSRVLIVEDDLDIGADFLPYFYGLAPILEQDPTLWCISAWNDNGKFNLINVNASSLLYRSDFFPGLGWLTTRPVWQELRQEWPVAFWDDHLRKHSVRKDRQCIRPEISRTHTFGRVGVSLGQFFDSHLKYIELYNASEVRFDKMDLTYLMPEQYSPAWKKQVYNNSRLIALDSFLQPSGTSSTVTYRIEYRSNKELQNILNKLGAMSDLKDGVARTAYQGVVTLLHHNVRVFIAPPKDSWSGYVHD